MNAAGSHASSEVAYVICADLVGYSLKPVEGQSEIVRKFKQAVRECSRLEEPNPPLALDTGDGVVLVYFGAPSHAIDHAVALACTLNKQRIEVRIGIHCGVASRTQDVNGQPNVTGPAINIAERVMNCADPGQILLSGAAAEMIGSHSQWKPHIYDLGEHEVKHGVRIFVSSFVFEDFGDPSLPTRLKGQAASVQRHNIPEPERPFVGRRVERENLAQRLEDPVHRLVTVTGPGGIGKTSLASHVARDLVANFVDGVWLVECDLVESAEDLLKRIGAAFNLSAEDVILEYLSDKQMLFVIDRFEEAVSYSGVLDRVLKHCPDLKMVVTSRILLGLPREVELALGPLSLRRDGAGQADAIALFVEAAKATSDRFRITRSNHETIESIVEMVEAIPLGIILAAGRLRHLSLNELHDQLGKRRLEILKRRSPVPDRQSSLARVVHDSFSLLRPELRDLLVSLSVFRGGFHIRDAEAILGYTPEVLDGISELRENSLLVTVSSGDHMRYRSLDVVSEYVQSIADPVNLKPLVKKHAEYFAKRATEVREFFEDAQWRKANENLNAELGNYRRAIHYAVEENDEPLIRSLGSSLCRILMEAGYRADFEKLVLAAQELAQRDGDIRMLMETTGLLGGVYKRDKNYGEAERLWQKRAYYCRELGAIEEEADICADLADVALLQGDQARCASYLDRFTELEPLLEPGLILATGLCMKARYYARVGNMEEGLACANKAFQLSTSFPQRIHSFYVWTSLAEAFLILGHPKLTERICREGMCETIESRHFASAGWLMLRLSQSLEQSGRLPMAAKALSIAQSVPKSFSQTLREQVMGFRQQFANRNASKIRIEDANTLDWQLAAIELVGELDGVSLS